VTARAAHLTIARDTVPHARPALGAEEERAAMRVLGSGRLAPGSEAARLDALVARLADGADAVSLASGTLALTLALRALGLGQGDEVAIPTYGPAALLHAVRSSGASPLLCDIDPGSLALDPHDLARRASPRLRAVILVHPFGTPARLEPFRALGLMVVEDCAQAAGASDRGRPVGSRGDAAVFSFGPTMMLTCGGPGGALAAPRAALVRLAREAATHTERPVDRLRINGLMGNLHASIAAVQVGRLGEFVARRAAITARYDEAFARLPLGRPAAPADTWPVVHRYVVRTPHAAELLSSLNRHGVMARRPVYRPLHRLLGEEAGFPAADAAHDELVSLPIAAALHDHEVERVIDEVLRCLS
jgi:perosamine synthetase